MKDGDIPQIGVDIYTPDFCGLGKAFGCEVSRVTSLNELKLQLTIASQRQSPTVIEVVEADIVDGYPMA
jgi:acetolactate synthase-1/2/3 large subunit